MHGFDPSDDGSNNFPPQEQNTMIYVVDPICKKVYCRSLDDPESGLTQDQIDSLSTTSPQYNQEGSTLYIVGGYGFRHSIEDYTTFEFLSALDIPGLMRWVICEPEGESAQQHIRQITDPIFKITGGEMSKLGKCMPTLLALGQDFEGAYFSESSVQTYSNQVRRFYIHDDGVNLSVEILLSLPLSPDPNLRRRDLNVVPMVKAHKGKLIPELVALSGVFTENDGIWTVPVSISACGHSFMADPADPCTFKQGMNNYDSATLGLYSKRTGDMYTILFGGISYGFFQDGVFKTDDQFPFINQITTVKKNRKGHYTQYLMAAEYPEIRSTQSNPGNLLLFGADARFVPTSGLECYLYGNGVFKFDRIVRSMEIGYIVGGIQSSLPNTTKMSDSAASPYIFKVCLEPKNHCFK
jgi:hypothetical protein